MSTWEALEELTSSPEFLEHVARLNEVAEDERRRRERFVEELDEDTKAEFIHGQVVTHSPARLGHTRATLNIAFLLTAYYRKHALGEVTVGKSLVRYQRNDYEPDICFFRQAKCEGWENDKLIFPPPDLVVEVLSPSTERNERTVKLRDYARHGVGEYWIVDADALAVEQYILLPNANECDQTSRFFEQDRITSTVLGGFGVPVRAFFDAQENQSALQALMQ